MRNSVLETSQRAAALRLAGLQIGAAWRNTPAAAAAAVGEAADVPGPQKLHADQGEVRAELVNIDWQPQHKAAGAAESAGVDADAEGA